MDYPREEDSFSDVSSVYSDSNSIASTQDGKKIRVRAVKSRFMEGISNPKTKAAFATPSNLSQKPSHSTSTKVASSKMPPSFKPPPPKPSHSRTAAAIRSTSNQSEKATWNPPEKATPLSSPARSTPAQIASSLASASGQRMSAKPNSKPGSRTAFPVLTSYSGLDRAQLLQVKLLQWVFLTEKAKLVLHSLIETKERGLCEALKATLSLQQSISQIQIQLDKFRHCIQLEEVMDQFDPLLNEWCVMKAKHASNIRELIKVLENAVLRLSLINGATGNAKEIEENLSEINSLVIQYKPIVEKNYMPVEEASILSSDYATCSFEMRSISLEASNLLQELSSLELHERSLKAQLIQLERAKKTKMNGNDLPKRVYNFMNPT